MWAFATLLYHVIQLSGGLGQALKQSAQRFKSMFWLTKGILFASQEIKSMVFSWVWGPRQKDFGLEGCGKRMSDTWSSEIQKYMYGVIFQSFSFRSLVSWRKTKGLGRILPLGRGLPHHQSLLLELQNPPWFRSIDLRFGCCGFWFGSRLLGEFFARICRAWFLNYTRIWGFVEFGSDWKYYSSAGCF